MSVVFIETLRKFLTWTVAFIDDFEFNLVHAIVSSIIILPYEHQMNSVVRKLDFIKFLNLTLN